MDDFGTTKTGILEFKDQISEVEMNDIDICLGELGVAMNNLYLARGRMQVLKERRHAASIDVGPENEILTDIIDMAIVDMGIISIRIEAAALRVASINVAKNKPDPHSEVGAANMDIKK